MREGGERKEEEGNKKGGGTEGDRRHVPGDQDDDEGDGLRQGGARKVARRLERKGGRGTAKVQVEEEEGEIDNGMESLSRRAKGRRREAKEDREDRGIRDRRAKHLEEAVTTANRTATSWADLAKRSVPVASNGEAEGHVEASARSETSAEPQDKDKEGKEEVGGEGEQENQDAGGVETAEVKAHKPPAWGNGSTTDKDVLLKIESLLDPSLHLELPSRQPRGMVNMGNLCFMNAVLQSLIGCRAFFQLLHGLLNSHIPRELKTLSSFVSLASEFVELETAPPPSQDVKDANKEAKETSSTDAAAAAVLVRSLKSSTPLNPGYFFDLVSTFAPTDPVRPGRGKARQEDAQEFLSFLLNCLHDEFVSFENRVLSADGNGPNGGSGEDGGSSTTGADASPDDDDWQEVGGHAKVTFVRKLNMETSPVSKIFGGQFRTTIRYSSTKASASLEPFLCINLDIAMESSHKDVKSVTLHEIISSYFKPEKLDGVVNGCQEGKAQRHAQIEKGPDVLVLHLKRFRFDGASAHKILTRVSYPDTLSLEEYCVKGVGQDFQHYRLVAVVSHHGSKMHHGHYTSMVRQPTGQWIRLDDHNLEIVLEQESSSACFHPLSLLPSPPCPPLKCWTSNNTLTCSCTRDV
ncbi:hypothetical protein GUITHDRAFT_165307 [Guillardia theta CCMP2712]|uniref:Ubiquitin carboxyl-terminal hydrolase n=1 Tax=Guillardia theta (strain CCMP2712) TaxID=905079 RepID=L1IQD3_GUITC|nr:hypothetical protein GUITHDRAFT_165307 [Guillardia theta CCMP2712]EKX38040.1 hypothetical protein GUITHDRAFT_165307 [Guillardia theta CCMP2712]|eukprot:XP_005825020.1 hypothetical protein GUITHDRAFT_165307 [Guillardia theta CCMP2712]